MNRFKRRALRVSNSALHLSMSVIPQIVPIFYQMDMFWQVIADHLSTEEVEDIKEMFKLIDTDNDGIVGSEELKIGLSKHGSHLGESEVQMLIEAVSLS